MKAASNESLDCSCRHCGIQLEISIEHAGVTAPCPNCGNGITAPPAPMRSLPHKQKLDEEASRSQFNERISQPHIGLHEHTEEQYSNVEKAPAIARRPRVVKNPPEQDYPQAVPPPYYPYPYQVPPQPGDPVQQAYPVQQAPVHQPESMSQSQGKPRIMPTAGLSTSYDDKKDSQAFIKIAIAAIFALALVGLIAMAVMLN